MTTTATTWPVLDDAHEALRATVRSVPAGDWHRPTPCRQWTVTQVLQHAAGDQLSYAAFLTGEPGPRDDPFAPSGTLDGSPTELAERAIQAAANAWATVDPDAEDVVVPAPPGRLPAPLGVGACALDAAVHTWDIAVATGQPSPLAAELVRQLMAVATSLVEPLRAFGAYAAALDPQDGDDEVTALLRYLGRQPDWTPNQ